MNTAPALSPAIVALIQRGGGYAEPTRRGGYGAHWQLADCALLPAALPLAWVDGMLYPAGWSGGELVAIRSAREAEALLSPEMVAALARVAQVVVQAARERAA